MVRYAPRFTPFLRIRETLPRALEYGAPAAAPVPDTSSKPHVPAPAGPPDVPRPASQPGPIRDLASSPVPDPFDDADALEDLGDRIATLAAHIHAATYRLLTLVAEFDRRRGWEMGGHRSCAHWLASRTGMDLGAAREKVRAARVLVNLPETGTFMARGELSFSAVRALTRVATPENEGDLLELAKGCTTAQLERLVRGWKRGSRKDEAELERERHESRTFSVFPDEDGMYVVRGRLDPEVGALLMRAIEAASDALFREDPGVPGTEDDTARAAAQRRADAMGLLAERALAAGFGAPSSEERCNGLECSCPDRPRGAATDETSSSGSEGWSRDAEGGHGSCGCSHAPAPISGTRAERYQVHVHGDLDTLSKDVEPGLSELEDGTRVSAETFRRLACDAAVVRVTRGSDGSILDVGRRTRSIPPALRRALEVRDRGCRFPTTRLWRAVPAASASSTAGGNRPSSRSDRWKRSSSGSGATAWTPTAGRPPPYGSAKPTSRMTSTSRPWRPSCNDAGV